uniref:TNF family profile domain-containing protein n=1 Tax=Macrostomum lignano TaxID=282301 RepID=A0A1I8G0K9_9PLAT
MEENSPPLPPRIACPPKLPPRPQQHEQSINQSQQQPQHLDNRNSVSSSLYTCIHSERVDDAIDQQLQSTEKPTVQTSATTTTHSKVKNRKKENRNRSTKEAATTNSKNTRTISKCRLNDPRLWLFAQTALVAAFSVACVALRLARQEHLASVKLESDRAWMRLVFQTKLMDVCHSTVGKRRLDNGCLQGTDYVTTGHSFGPLTEDSIKPSARGYSMRNRSKEFAQLHHDGQMAKLIINHLGVYRVFAQVTFRDDITDMPVETSIQLNNNNWIHCEQSHLAGAFTKCILYGVRRLKKNDKLTFVCIDKFRKISVLPNQ